MAMVRVLETRAQPPLPLNTVTIASEPQWPEPIPLQLLQELSCRSSEVKPNNCFTRQCEAKARIQGTAFTPPKRLSLDPNNEITANSELLTSTELTEASLQAQQAPLSLSSPFYRLRP